MFAIRRILVRPKSARHPNGAFANGILGQTQRFVIMAKATTVAESLFRAIAGQRSDVTIRHMFGCPCAFVNGQMFAGVYQARIFLRLDPQTRERTLSQSADLFAPGGPAMKQYVLLSESMHDQERELLALFQQSHAFACGLPPKSPKPRSTKRPRRS